MSWEQQVICSSCNLLRFSADLGQVRFAKSVVHSSSSVERCLTMMTEKAKKVDEVARIIDADCELVFIMFGARLTAVPLCGKWPDSCMEGFRA